MKISCFYKTVVAAIFKKTLDLELKPLIISIKWVPKQTLACVIMHFGDSYEK